MKNNIMMLMYGLLLFLLIQCAVDPDEIPQNNISVSPNDSVTAEIKYSESITINNSLTIYFKDVSADSRCPIDAVCVWEGDGEVTLIIKNNQLEKEVKIHTALYPKEIYFDGYLISIKELLPYPKTTQTIKKGDYKITLAIKNAAAKEPLPVVIIDESSDWMIKKDLLAINDLKIEGSILTASFSYSGGCKEHSILLFAKNGILKSNPPQMNLYFSHLANGDACEAYLTKIIKFDLKQIKEYLIRGMGVSGKVILNFYNTDGNIAKQSPLEFNLLK